VTRLAFLLVATILLAAQPATILAQDANSASAPHKIALIDISKVLKNYKKVDALRAEIKAEIAKSEPHRTSIGKKLETLKKRLVSGSIEPGSAKAAELEQQADSLKAELVVFNKNERKRILRREAQLLKTIHGEIKGVVKRAADAWGYTLVLRFNSSSTEATTPNSVVGELQRQVVYHRAEDDITKPVIEFLNKQFLKQSPAPRTGAQPAGATKTK
jgi:Skp family chaperone for outer membrane proteins